MRIVQYLIYFLYFIVNYDSDFVIMAWIELNELYSRYICDSKPYLQVIVSRNIAKIYNKCVIIMWL